MKGNSAALAVASLTLALAGCSTAARTNSLAEPLVSIQEGRFIERAGNSARPFIPWGFNYDRTVVEGRDMLLEDVLRERPAIVAEDFAAMRRLNGNTVRIFIATGEILSGPDQVDPQGLVRLDLVLDMADAAGIKAILVGLATLRPATIPTWLQSASDEQIEAAEVLFWRTVARACRGRGAIFAYDLQNEPVVHWSNSDDLIVGCFDMPDNQKFCYVHKHYLRIEARWTRHVQANYGTEDELKKHWPDYPRPGENWDKIAVSAFDGKDPRFAEYAAWHKTVFAGWARRLASTIRAEDDTHLITVGALDPVPLADAVDFYCYHLYPLAAGADEDYIAKSRADWEKRLRKIPRDKPLVIEEFYPMWMPATIKPAEVLDAMLATTRDRCAGWVSFYWGPPDRLTWAMPAGRDLYASWLAAWSDRAPSEIAPTTAPTTQTATTQTARPRP